MPQKEIVIENKNELFKIFKIITWLDEKRWCKENQEKEREKIIKNFCKKLTSSEKILTHWLCYITDRQMPYKRIY